MCDINIYRQSDCISIHSSIHINIWYLLVSSLICHFLRWMQIPGNYQYSSRSFRIESIVQQSSHDQCTHEENVDIIEQVGYVDQPVQGCIKYTLGYRHILSIYDRYVVYSINWWPTAIWTEIWTLRDPTCGIVVRRPSWPQCQSVRPVGPSDGARTR